MPRKSAKQTGIEIIAIVIILSVIAVSALFKTLVDNPWVFIVLVGIVGFAVWYMRYDKKLQTEIKIKARQTEEEKLRQTNAKNEEIKKRRIEETLAHQDEWGAELCQWLIDKRIPASNDRVTKIMSRKPEWGLETCKDLVMGNIEIDMTVEMITFSFGEPDNTDNKVKTAKSEKFRYVYGVPRQGATYISFKNGKVVKVMQ